MRKAAWTVSQPSAVLRIQSLISWMLILIWISAKTLEATKADCNIVPATVQLRYNVLCDFTSVVWCILLYIEYGGMWCSSGGISGLNMKLWDGTLTFPFLFTIAKCTFLTSHEWAAFGKGCDPENVANVVQSQKWFYFLLYKVINFT